MAGCAGRERLTDVVPRLPAGARLGAVTLRWTNAIGVGKDDIDDGDVTELPMLADPSQQAHHGDTPSTGLDGRPPEGAEQLRRVRAWRAREPPGDS
ncbi:hypothetical protein [Streptomyces sp. 8N706]|uniref:hypothetical protein n=1 Tax=Streptomyces sp. 8N706 TaxID=3457416 RepID=UPI003FD5CE65